MSKARFRISVLARDAGRTLALGRALGVLLGAGQVVFVEGPLGAGKTCLIRGICAGTGYGGRVRSPSFAIVNEYVGEIRIYHIDLYRIPAESPELEDLSRQEYFCEGALTLVEWGNKLRAWGVVPSLAATLELVGEEARRIVLETDDAALGERLRSLPDSL